MNVSMKIKGTTSLPNIVRQSPQLQKKWTRKGAEALLPIAQRECPVETGDLRDSHAIMEDGDGYAVTAGGPKAPYALFRFYGTRYMPADPWLSRAAEHAWPTILASVDEIEYMLQIMAHYQENIR